MDLYCGNFNYLLLLLALLLVAAPGQLLDTTTRTAVQGGEASLECQTKSERCSNIEWHYSNIKLPGSLLIIYKGGNILNDSNGKYSITAESSSGKCVLVIKNVSIEDSGTYVCSDNRDELLQAELIVFEKYPSKLFCSISVRPNDLLLGSNDCNLPPDTVEALCEMKFRDNSDLRPKLEWEIDGIRIQADESTRDDNTTVSRIHVSASDLSSSSLFVCRVKYGNKDIQTNLIWSKQVNATSIRDTNDWTEVPCTQTIVSCSEIDEATHSYSWVNDNNIRMSENTQLDLKGKPTGNYSCVVTRSVRNKWCTYIVKKVLFTCNDAQKSVGGTTETPEKIHDRVVIATVSLCVVGVTVVILIIAWTRFRRTRNTRLRANNDEETNENLTSDATHEQSHSDERHTEIFESER